MGQGLVMRPRSAEIWRWAAQHHLRHAGVRDFKKGGDVAGDAGVRAPRPPHACGGFLPPRDVGRRRSPGYFRRLRCSPPVAEKGGGGCVGLGGDSSSEWR
jgi:hypothetical protein